MNAFISQDQPKKEPKMPLQTYCFSLDPFTIHTTRSLSKDTDYVSLSLSVGIDQGLQVDIAPTPGRW